MGIVTQTQQGLKFIDNSFEIVHLDGTTSTTMLTVSKPAAGANSFDFNGEAYFKNASTRYLILNYEDSVNTIASASATGSASSIESLNIRGDNVRFYTGYGTNNVRGSLTLTLDNSNNAIFTGDVLINQTSNLTNQALQVNGFIDITAVSGKALRWYNGSTFRGGLGSDDWAMSGTAADTTMYIAGDNSFFVATNNVKRLEIDSSGSTFAGRIKPLQGMESAYGVYTDGGTYTNQWQKVLSIPYASNMFGYAGIVLSIMQIGATNGAGAHADIHIHYKFQSNNGRLNANIINYGETEIDANHIAIRRDHSNLRIELYHKVTTNYTSPRYLLKHNTTTVTWYNTVTGNDTALAATTDDGFTELNITNGFTSNPFDGSATFEGDVIANVAGNGVIRAAYDTNNMAQLQANSSGGVFGANAGGTTKILLRSYGDSYFTGGKVGIATNNPLHTLQIGEAATNGSYSMMVEGNFADNNLSSNPRINLIDTNFGITAGKYASSGAHDAIGIFAYQGAGRGILFAHTTAGSGTHLKDMRHDMFVDGGTGNVGIGETDPFGRLNVTRAGINE